MTKNNRDDFSQKIKDNLANRVNNRCSRCYKATSGPQQQDTGAVNLGVAAHICAAAPGGPRYNEGMTSDQRASIENGIWLCLNCAALIDKDEKSYSVEKLHEIKEQAENRALAEINNSNSTSPDIFPGKSNDSLLATLLAESNGKCLKCGKTLGMPKRGKIPVKNCEIVYLKRSPDEPERYENAVVLCSNDCAPIVSEMSRNEISEILESKRRCSDIQNFLDRISSIKFSDEIETVLREINEIKNTTGLELTGFKDLVEIERKIDEPFLKDRINSSMARLYKTVKEICGRLEQEIGFDTNIFGSLMKAAQLMIETEVRQKTDISDPQGYITKLLVDNLCSQVGQKHEDACEIIVGYLVKRCDLFNANAQQS